MGGFWYLATPYSKYSRGITEAFEDAASIAGTLVEKGIRIYSPIAHSHPIAVHGDIDPEDHSIWLSLDEPFMEAAVGLIVAKMAGWDVSYGIEKEIKAFRQMKKPIMYLEVDERNENV